jgi:ADP-heptose:LPS heptosyltransferase
VLRHLQIYDPRERWIVGLADLALGAAAVLPRALHRPSAKAPARILLLRLERIGDLLMALGAIRAVREHAPDARIDLAVGSWNEAIARLIPGIDLVETVDAPWLARGADGGYRVLVRAARAWRARGYDLAINFEPDIRTNLLLAFGGAPARIGFSSGGGAAALTSAIAYDPRRHTAENALRLVQVAFGAPLEDAERWRERPASLELPDDAVAAGRALLERAASEAGIEPSRLVRAPLVGIHASGGREIKQWSPARFAAVAASLHQSEGAITVLTGGPGDRAVVDAVRAALPPGTPAIDLAGRADLVTLAGALRHLALLVTGDTGPMHLAAAVGVPLVAIFGPSDPARYAPAGERARIVRVSLPCSPCNRIRLPPARCVGHVPDCLDRIGADAVLAPARELLHARQATPPLR